MGSGRVLYRPPMRTFIAAVLAAVVSAMLPAGAQTNAPKIVPNPDAFKVLCAGDSITQRGYPEVLQGLLGPGYAVANAGHSGVTALKHAGTRSYPNAGPKTRADIVVIMLGTNDAKVETWTKFKDQFVKDYTELVESFRKLSPQPKVFVALPPQIFRRDTGTGFSAANLEEAVALTRQVAAASGCLLIDVHAALAHQPEKFGDGVHPNDAGKAVIAKAVSDAIAATKSK